jgi:hypothetical protein
MAASQTAPDTKRISRTVNQSKLFLALRSCWDSGRKANGQLAHRLGAGEKCGGLNAIDGVGTALEGCTTGTALSCENSTSREVRVGQSIWEHGDVGDRLDWLAGGR